MTLTVTAGPGVPVAHHSEVRQPASIDEQESGARASEIHATRRYIWRVLAGLTESARGAVPIEDWYGEEAVFAPADSGSPEPGIRGFARAPESVAAANGFAAESAEVPVLTYTLYNESAYRHIRDHRLQLASELEKLRVLGLPDPAFAGDRSVPPFPREAAVLKTVWWPVAQHGLTALPVWDPPSNAMRSSGNPYITWRRVVGVDPEGAHPSSTVSVDFGGVSYPRARRVGLDRFFYVRVDADLARRLALDQTANKTAVVVLGRRIAVGDYLIWVAGNLATRQRPDWVWAALWWHDRPDEGSFAADKPATLHSALRNYLLQVAFDESRPAASDGGPHICFNPWLEARFPDTGQGSGVVSNCMACHRRASYPPVYALQVTRGPPDARNDPAYAPRRLRTSFIWAIPLHARSGSDGLMGNAARAAAASRF